MKNIPYLFLCLIALTISSCDLTSTSNTTPEIYIMGGSPLLNGTDTLSIVYSNSDSKYILDTISVNDTVQFGFIFYSYANNIEYISIAADTNYINVDYGSTNTLDSLFLSTSNYATGLFQLPLGINQVYFPYKYIPQKAGNDINMTITVKSDADMDANYKTFTLKTPVKN